MVEGYGVNACRIHSLEEGRKKNAQGARREGLVHSRSHLNNMLKTTVGGLELCYIPTIGDI
jgi:hypothetical protein